MPRSRHSGSTARNEEFIIEELLKEAHSMKVVEARQWTAPWLLAPIHGPFWLLRLDGSNLVDGGWRNVLRVEWNDKLPDGSRLGDECNKRYLEFLQQAAFLIREEVLDIRSSNSHVLYIYILKALTQWIFSQSNLYSPSLHGFSKVDLAGIHDFMKRYTRGALFEAGNYAARFLESIDIDSVTAWRRTKKNASLYELPGDIARAVSEKLKEMDFYSATIGTGPNKGLMSVDRIKAAELLQTNVHVLGTARAIAFFRQFEEDYIRKFGKLLVKTAAFNTEFISHRTKFIDELDSIPLAQVRQAVFSIEALEKLSPALPFSIPPFTPSFMRSPLRRYFNDAGKSEHTPWMPMDISMVYLNESLRWVLEYGSDLVEFYLQATNYFKQHGVLDGPSRDDLRRQRNQCREAWTRENLPQSLRAAGIERWCSTTRSPVKKRCSVISAMIVFLGACMYVISGLLPIRIDELSSLKRTCLTFKDGCGYWIEKRRGKAVEEDTHESIRVPVPGVSATAVRLLLHLGTESQKIFPRSDHNDARYLLYLPVFHNVESVEMNRRPKESINYAIDMFCDYVGLPPDKYGRRWYARVHENRKSFLLTFVWYFKFSALDAARWLAGHTDSKFILAYIKTNLKEGDATELESQFLAEALWNFGLSKRRSHEIKNISNLYRRVCKHFHVSEISEVRERELSECLDLMLIEKKLQIDVLNITTSSGAHRIALRVRMSGEINDSE